MTRVSRILFELRSPQGYAILHFTAGPWVWTTFGLEHWCVMHSRATVRNIVYACCVCALRGAFSTRVIVIFVIAALLVLPMCRRTLTYLRATRLASLLPFDDSTRLHRAMAFIICVATVVHGGGQVGAAAVAVWLV